MDPRLRGDDRRESKGKKKERVMSKSFECPLNKSYRTNGSPPTRG